MCLVIVNVIGEDNVFEIEVVMVGEDFGLYGCIE